jgi:hypothetical protein
MTTLLNFLKMSAVSLTFVAILIAATANIKGDIYTYGLGTADNASAWQVAELMTSASGDYKNPVAQWSNSANMNRYISVGTTWNDIRKKLEGNWNQSIWKEAAQGDYETWKNGSQWITPYIDDVNYGENGFYGYKYTLTASDANALTVSGTLNMTISGDDYIAAIYANGSLLYYDELKWGAIAGTDANKQGNWLYLMDGLKFDVDLVNGMLDLVFVVHNTNEGMVNTENPTGFYADGFLTTNIDMLPPGESAVPEPATLAVIGLGLAGLGLAHRLRKKKM